MLQVFERPPLRLSVNVETPSGARARWGADDPDPANQPGGLSFGTSMPGGFADMSCSLARDPRRDWPDTEELSDVKVRDPGGEVAWEGRLEKLPDTGGDQALLSPQAVGYQSVLNDDSTAREIYLDGALTDWQGASVQRQINLLGEGAIEMDASASVDQTTGEPALVTALTGPWARLAFSEGWYDAKGVDLGHLYYAWKLQAANAIGDDTVTDVANWTLQALLCADDVASTVISSGNLMTSANMGAAALTGVVSASDAGSRFALVQLSNDVPGGGTDGTAYPVFWTYLGVVGSHGCPIQGTLNATGGIGILASDIAAHAVGRWASQIAFTTGTEGTIQPSTYAIPQAVFTDPTTAGGIIKQVVQYEMLDWAVWEGPTFYLNPRGESAKTRNWRARIGPAQLQETGPDVSRIYNGVLVQYNGVDGLTHTIGPPGSGAQIESSRLLDSDPANPANQITLANGRVLRRWAIVQVGDTTADGALQVGQIFLQVQKLADTSGQAALVGYVQDNDTGIWWPAWKARAGDTITFTDARDTRARRIVSTSYDHSSKTNTLQLDQPPDVMSALLAELSEAVAPLGLS